MFLQTKIHLVVQYQYSHVIKDVSAGDFDLFIENDTFFFRDGVYGYKDDAARFSFFNVAVLDIDTIGMK